MCSTRDFKLISVEAQHGCMHAILCVRVFEKLLLNDASLVFRTHTQFLIAGKVVLILNVGGISFPGRRRYFGPRTTCPGGHLVWGNIWYVGTHGPPTTVEARKYHAWSCRHKPSFDLALPSGLSSIQFSIAYSLLQVITNWTLGNLGTSLVLIWKTCSVTF